MSRDLYEHEVPAADNTRGTEAAVRSLPDTERALAAPDSRPHGRIPTRFPVVPAKSNHERSMERDVCV